MFLLSAIWGIFIFFINPLGEFPLNDDWVYSRSVQHFISNGEIYLGSSNANLITHMLWGSLFTSIFGLSFSILRVSIIIMGLLGLWTTYYFLKENRCSPLMAFFGALFVAINPVYLTLSNTFMTDVSFYVYTVFASIFLIKGLKSDQSKMMILGLFLGMIALLNRQIGLALFLAFAPAYWVKKRFSFKGFLGMLCILITPFLIQIIYQNFLSFIGAVIDSHNDYAGLLQRNVQDGLLAVIVRLSKSIDYLFVYIGLFIFPWLFFYGIHLFKLLDKRKKWIVLGAIFVFLLVNFQGIFMDEKWMPFIKNILTYYGIGPLTLRDTDVFGLNMPGVPKTPFHELFLMGMTLVGRFSGFLLFLLVLKRTFDGLKAFEKKEFPEELPVTVFSVLFILITFAPIALTDPFDRYLLPLIPFAMILVSLGLSQKDREFISPGKIAMPSLALCIVFVGYFSIFSVHDYISWNRIRWKALHFLMAKNNIPPTQIDGGYEFGGWYLYHKDYQRISLAVRSNWWVIQDDFTITFGPIRGYKIVKKFDVPRKLSVSPGEIYILQKPHLPDFVNKAN